MKGYENSKKKELLDSIITESFDNDRSDITVRCKFNFSYFEVQDGVGQAFEQWNQNQLVKLLEKLKTYSRESLLHWTRKRIGSGNSGRNVLEYYGDFPNKKQCEFLRPKSIPHQANWGRFRLEQSVRLVGFSVPEDYNGKIHQKTGKHFDCNTFYVVFLDKDHVFYKTEMA